MSLLSQIWPGLDPGRRSPLPAVLQPPGRSLQRALKSTKEALHRKTTQLFLDGAVIALAWGLAYFVRFDGSFVNPYSEHLYTLVAPVVGIYYGGFHLTGIYRLVWRWVTVKDAVLILAATLACGAVVGLADLVRTAAYGVSRVPIGVLILHPVFCAAGCLGLRVLRRSTHDWIFGDDNLRRDAKRKRVILAGTGRTGVLLAGEILSDRQFELVGFVDDDPEMQGRRIEGRPVLGTARNPDAALANREVDELILCMPGATLLQRLEIARSWRRCGVEVSTVPSLRQLANGKVQLSHLKPVKMEQLLGRAVVHLSADSNTRAAYEGSCILVTGGAGSIGSEIVRQLNQLSPSRIVVLDKDENAVFEICHSLAKTQPSVEPVVANVRDRKRLDQVFDEFRPQAVFHAAAYKHVPLMEHCPQEAILNNVMGTKHVLDASVRVGVKRFVLISTDKAINPANAMGASKRLAEQLASLYAVAHPATKISAVRFGNVLGSRASVIPIFQSQIRDGKSITITHPDVRRYFMTIPEATSLVIQAGSIAVGGELFVLDMGSPVRIVDLARQLIELSGLEPTRDIKIEYVGLRPGEKMHEELFFSNESQVRSTLYPKIFVVASDTPPARFMETVYAPLVRAAQQGDIGEIKSLLRTMGVAYTQESRNGEMTTKMKKKHMHIELGTAPPRDAAV